MIQITEDDIVNVERMITGRRVDTVLTGVINDLSMPPRSTSGKHIDAHDRANIGAILRLALDILVLDGKSGEVFGNKLTESDPKLLRNTAIGLAKALKAGVRI